MSLGGRCQLVTVNQVNMKFKVPIEFGLQLSCALKARFPHIALSIYQLGMETRQVKNMEDGGQGPCETSRRGCSTPSCLTTKVC